MCVFQIATEVADRESALAKKKLIPSSNYKDKYKHLIGEDSAKDAAHTLEANKQFGFGKYTQRREY